MTIKFTFSDLERAHAEWKCSCGPATLAAICGLTLDEVRVHFPRLNGWTNPTMMFSALNSLGRSWPWSSIMVADRRPDWPRHGIARIQWEGPWTAPGANQRWAYRYTHWVGSRTRTGNVVTVWDLNAMTEDGAGDGWLLGDDWQRAIVPLLAADIKRATGGWHITHAIEVER